MILIYAIQGTDTNNTNNNTSGTTSSTNTSLLLVVLASLLMMSVPGTWYSVVHQALEFLF